MSEETHRSESAEQSQSNGDSVSHHPFDETDAGKYRVVEPLDGATPNEISLTFGETTYTLSGYVGKDIQSKVRADVLVYDQLEVTTSHSEVASRNDPSVEDRKE